MKKRLPAQAAFLLAFRYSIVVLAMAISQAFGVSSLPMPGSVGTGRHPFSGCQLYLVMGVLMLRSS